jgi:catechol 2,3-dioxygenase-like lactoylglutathione lyase family enzyme
MKSPIMNQINTVFVHVSNLKRSVRWYSELLGQEYDLDEVTDPVYNITINHHTGLTLDAGPDGLTKKVEALEDPLFNFHTDDIDAAFSFVEEMGYEAAEGIVRFDDFSFFTVRDPDGNIVMICTR